jgi:hypothetical protein
MIKERLAPEELAIVELIRHPIWCAELVRNISRDDDDKWVHSDYQREMLCDFGHFIVLCCGRAVGKTETLVDKVIWHALNNFYEESLVFTVPNRVHLEPPFMKLVKWFRGHPLLMHYVDKGSINMANFTIRLKNRFVLDCRIAGMTGGGANVVGLHVPFILLDEAAFYPWGTYIELMPTLNTFQNGFQLMVSGVPDGKRERSVLYYADQVDPEYNKHRIAAHQNPRYSAADEARNRKQFRGNTSQEYLHMVLGEHGTPVFSMFDRDSMAIEDYTTHITKHKGAEFVNDSQFAYKLLASLPSVPPYSEDLIFGIDLGFTDPTVIQVLYRLRDKWYILTRVMVHQLEYPEQERFIDLLDNKYKPTLIGIDEGNIGKSVVQHLMSDPQYGSKNYKKIIKPIQFGGRTKIGEDDEGTPLETRTKQFAMQYLQNVVTNRELIFSKNDEEMISELERTSYTRTDTGELKFYVESLDGKTKGEDHNTQALCCALTAWWQEHEMQTRNAEVKLLRTFIWNT